LRPFESLYSLTAANYRGNGGSSVDEERFEMARLTNLLRWPSDATNLYKVSCWILVIIAGGLLTIWYDGSVVMWALAALASGGLLGFLFGVPRVEQSFATGDASPDGAAPESASGTVYRQTVNTNLTEISDWLTKIIVGVSLVQLTKIPPRFQSLAEYLAGNEHDPGFVGGILVFFGVTGFLSGYLLTRLFLAGAFSEADRAANDFDLSARRLPVRPMLESAMTSQARELQNLLVMSPRAAVIANWERLADAVQAAVGRHESRDRYAAQNVLLGSTLRELGLLDPSDARLFDDLRRLRDLATQSSQSISQRAANDYISNAEVLIERLEATRSADPGAG